TAPANQPPQVSFDVILLDLAFASTGENGLAFLAELTHQFPTIPVIVLTGCDRLADRVEVARLGGRAFVQKPIVPQTLLQTVSQILTQSSDTPQRVLVVDDDAQLLENFQTLLEPWGVQVITLDHAQQFWETLEASAPDLLILDLEMPQFGGLELCRAVRNDPYWGETPILILATHPTDTDVQQVFSAGADDYVIKPIREPELVARVLNRLERERMRHARRQAHS
ncbi:MAG TPA: response regulator transcription factor, partial [Stenomitos sp.]